MGVYFSGRFELLFYFQFSIQNLLVLFWTIFLSGDNRRQLKNRRKSAINRHDLVGAVRHYSPTAGHFWGPQWGPSEKVLPECPHALERCCDPRGQARPKPIKLSGERGLFLLVQPSGGNTPWKRYLSPAADLRRARVRGLEISP